jgi:selenocysteine-specific elongation factor
VVTGTATAGHIATDAAVRVLPGDHSARVRAIQVHGETVPAAHYGQRIALNLSGVDRADIGRGHVVCAPELNRATLRFDARVELRAAARPPDRQSHHRTRASRHRRSARKGRVARRSCDAGRRSSSAYAQIVLREPMLACGGDRFVLRDQNARRTIGGGIVIHPFARSSRRRPDARVATLARVDHATSVAERVHALLDLESAFAVTPEHLAATANLTVAAVQHITLAYPDIRSLPDAAQAQAYTTAGKWEQLRAAIAHALSTFHAAQPRQLGMEMESLRSQVTPETAAKEFSRGS